MSTTAQQELATPVKRAVGNFVWYELRTTDSKGAEDFYTHVVGWKADRMSDAGDVPYTILSMDGSNIAGLMQLTPDMVAGCMRPAWVGFVGVDDVDAYAKRVEEGGGKVLFGPEDIPGIGRFASVQDPQGASFVLFKGTQPAPPARPPANSPGTVGWHELSANDGPSAWPFYSRLFGWKEDGTMDMGPKGSYLMFNNGGAMMGGMMTRDLTQSPVPYWLYYLCVEDIDAAATRIRQKNGEILMGPHQVPGDTWIIVGLDPQRAVFAICGPRKQ